ncbi:glycosyltransferase [Psychrobacillus sp.]|uniref:glycosyltransferase n=1 Tax=Psychrobacillus sp. TaxID=1871623 RepID=UPI0028BD21CA|nr:glycosyltransferase [Psychrobacillus sp.]
MRVLHIIHHLDSGGAEKLLVDIAEEMKNTGLKVEVLVLSNDGDIYSEKLKSLDVPVHFSPVNIVYHPLQLFVIKKILKNNFDIVHTHLYAPQLYIAIVKGFLNVQTVYITTEHNTYNRRRDKRVFKYLDSWMYKKFTKIIAISEGTKNELNNYLPYTSKTTTVISNGIRLEQYIDAKPLKREELVKKINENDKLIIMIAAMREQKDHETLIRASNLLPENYHILFVGEGDRLKKVTDYAKKYGNNNIHFLGRRLDVPSILKTCDIFVLSSKWEGFGLVAVEAMAAGLPVIVSNVPGLREVVDGVGNFFEVGDEKELAQQILNTENETIDKHEANSLRNEKCLSYSIENTVSEYLQIYLEAINKPENFKIML